MDRFLREYQEIVEIGNAICADLRVGKICDALYREIFRIFPPGTVTAVALYVVDEQEKAYELLVCHREGARIDAPERLAFGRWAHADWSRERNRNLFIQDGHAEEGPPPDCCPFGRPASLVLVTLRRRGRPFGGILVQNSLTPRSFSTFQYRLLQMLADQIAVALEGARSIERLEEQSTIDALTGVLNRRALLETFSKEIKRASRPSHLKTTSFLMLDLDDFKRVNDTWGHLAGDYVLRETAQLVRRVLRVEDVLARYGGDEFAIILPETNLAGARVVGEKILEAVRALPLSYQEQSIRITVSIGIASEPGEAAVFIRQPTDADKKALASRFEERIRWLISTADAAMYRAKADGKDSVRCAEEANAPAVVPRETGDSAA